MPGIGPTPVRLREQRPPHSLLSTPENRVSTYKVEQQHVQHAGRDFHFVSYDAQPANERKGETAVPPMWYLMGPARRWPVMPYTLGQAEHDLQKALVSWLKEQGLVPAR